MFPFRLRLLTLKRPGRPHRPPVKRFLAAHLIGRTPYLTTRLSALGWTTARFIVPVRLNCKILRTDFDCAAVSSQSLAPDRTTYNLLRNLFEVCGGNGPYPPTTILLGRPLAPKTFSRCAAGNGPVPPATILIGPSLDGKGGIEIRPELP